jgi:hypothetical protein
MKGKLVEDKTWILNSFCYIFLVDLTIPFGNESTIIGELTWEPPMGSLSLLRRLGSTSALPTYIKTRAPLSPRFLPRFSISSISKHQILNPKHQDVSTRS